MDFKLGLVIVPVSDVDRAKAFYADKLGFTVDVDYRRSDVFRSSGKTFASEGTKIELWQPKSKPMPA